MNEALLATLLTALVAGLGGLLVPWLIARVPEPDQAADDKEPYAVIAGLRGLAWKSAGVSAVLGGVVGAATGLDWSLLWLAWLVPVSVALSLIDWRTRLLPRLIVLPATLLAVVVVVGVGLATGQGDAVVRALVAMLAVRTFFWLLWYLLSAGMGFGDVRLAALVGLALGWIGWGVVLVGVWVGFLAFGLPGLVLAVVRRDRSLLRKPLPYGPFMLLGALVGIVCGTEVAARLWS